LVNSFYQSMAPVIPNKTPSQKIISFIFVHLCSQEHYHNSEKMELTQLSIKEMLPPHANTHWNGILFRLKKEGSSDTGHKMWKT
jgi:hypothetical protein